MIDQPSILAGAILIGLTFYALLGGADFGGGVWDLLASGPRAHQQRELITRAIGPIWEANHVWLIAAITILFNAFPPAFAAVTTALHIPLLLMLLGIVLRGSAFTFRLYDVERDSAQQRYGAIFSIASTITPIFLGICIGALSWGRIQVSDGIVRSGFISSWLGLFPFAVGLLAVSLFTFLAAVYLAVEAEDPALREDFRRRALFAGVCTDLLAVTVLVLAEDSAALIYRTLVGSPLALLYVAATALIAAGALAALRQHRLILARLLTVLQVCAILWGWGLAQYPYLVAPSLSIYQAAAPPQTLRLIIIALILGGAVLFPSLYYLLRVFKGQRAFALLDTPAGYSRGERR